MIVLSVTCFFDAALLDVGDLEVDDILEARLKLRDELLAFRSELGRIQFEFEKEFGVEELARDGPRIVQARLIPKIKDIERRIGNARLTVLGKLVQVLKNPASYVPVVGSKFVGMPIELALMLGLGIITADVALEWWKEAREPRSDGLFYLLKLRKRVKDRSSFGAGVGIAAAPALTAAVALKTNFFLGGEISKIR